MQGCIFTLGRALLRKLTPAANRLFGPEMPLSCVDLNVPRKVSLTCRTAHSANQRTVDDRFQNNHHLLCTSQLNPPPPHPGQGGDLTLTAVKCPTPWGQIFCQNGSKCVKPQGSGNSNIKMENCKDSSRTDTNF